MRIDTVTTQVFEFNELGEAAQSAALDHLRDINTSDEWWHECVTDDAKRIGAILGMDITDVYFSGFWNQGDGAKFLGRYSYVKGAAKAIREECPRDIELHRIADALQELQSRHFYKLTAEVTDRGRYCHEYETWIAVHDQNGEAGIIAEDDLATLLRDFMRWIYRRLETEYEWLNSDECVTESIIANGYEFTQDGRLYR